MVVTEFLANYTVFVSLAHIHSSTEPLKVMGVSKMRVLVKETGKSTEAMFIIIPGRNVTLLGRSTSEVLGIFKVALQLNGCDMQYKSRPP